MANVIDDVKENIVGLLNSSPNKSVNRSVLETCNQNAASEKDCKNLVVKSTEQLLKPELDANNESKGLECKEAKKDSILTDSMLAEEQKLNEEGEKEEEKIEQQALDQWKEMSENIRLTQLNHLLEKSSVYANYLLGVIEESKKREKKRMQRKARKSKNKMSSKNLENGQAISQTSEIVTTSKKRKASDDTLGTPAKLQKTSQNIKAEKTNPDTQTVTKNKPLHTKYAVGAKIQVRKSNKIGEEDLLEATVIDTCLVKDAHKYLVHYTGLKKSGDEWIMGNMIVSDVFEDEDDNDDDEVETHRKKKATKLENEILKVDKNALLKAKFHTGVAIEQSLDSSDGVRYFKGQQIHEEQPELLTGGVLRDYQITGFKWLRVLYNNAVNGILADEMGLGKTIQCIAMICSLVNSGFKGPFLVCAPLSTICNWIIEFKKFAPQIPALLYHGSAAERVVLSSNIGKLVSGIGCCPVVITSYEILIRDRPALSTHTWDYLIIDEGHRIKNMNCRLLKELKLLKVNAKVLLTGTPLQNNLSELWSLLNFLLPEVFNDLKTFEAWFDLGKIQKGAQAISSAKEADVVVTLHKILAPFLLRRTKADIEIYLPPKRELLVFAPLSEDQNVFYQAVADRTIRKVVKNRSPEEDTEISIDLQSSDSNQSDEGFYERETRSSTLKYRLSKERDLCSVEEDSVINVSLSNLMMQLRKCCNHPYLIKYPLIPGTDIYRVDEEIVTSSGKLTLLDRMLPVLRKNGHKVLIFSQMTKILDILEDYCGFRGFSYFRLDGSTKCDVRQEFIDRFNNDPDQFIFLLSTRAGGLGINLTSADTVIIYDSDWNPQNDLQAQDRCHRIGQTRPVMIYRFVASNTVDQFMVERAEAKRVLERLIINRTKFKGKLAEDLNADKTSSTVVSTTLLSMLQASSGKEKCQQPISDDELGKILDRNFVMSCTNENLSCGVFQTED